MKKFKQIQVGKLRTTADLFYGSMKKGIPIEVVHYVLIRTLDKLVPDLHTLGFYLKSSMGKRI